jgi:hypothetical protein
MRILRRIIVGVLGIAMLGAGVGCESHAGTGALLGGAAGAGVGAIIGHNSHGRTAEGALIGGAIGAIGGGLIGNEADKEDRYHRDRAAYERGYEEARHPPRGRYYEREEYYHPAPRRHHHHDGHYESYRETRVYRRY